MNAGGLADRVRQNALDWRSWLLPVVVIGAGVLYPEYVETLQDSPLIGDFIPSLDSMVVMIVFTMMAVGLNVVVGYAGLLDLGYVAFYAAGAYVAAWFASQQFEQVTFHFGSVGIIGTLSGIHISVWLVLIIAGVFTTIVGILIGLPTLRLRGDYLAIVTLGFGEIVPQFVRNGDNVFGFDLTHGTFGISPIDAPGFGVTLNDTLGLPINYRQDFNRAQLFYLTALLLLLFTVFCSVRLRDSRLGRAWIAIREDETAAAAMGIPLMRTKTWSYAIGAFFGGVAGAYYASFKSGAFPADFYFNISVFLLCMVILGGIGSVWGVIVGGMLLGYLNVEGLATIGSKVREAGVDFEPSKYQFGIYGAIIVVMMLFRPTGLIPERRHQRELELGVEEESRSPDVPL
jgi:branched-chain amino acid transport system permease protein